MGGLFAAADQLVQDGKARAALRVSCLTSGLELPDQPSKTFRQFNAWEFKVGSSPDEDGGSQNLLLVWVLSRKCR